MNEPLFSTPDGNVMSRHWFLTHLKEILVRIGLATKAFSGHFFRPGAATTAAEAEIPHHLIKTLGKWTSDDYCH